MVDFDNLRSKLENDGLLKVKEKLSGNIYRIDKRPFVENWIEEKENENSKLSQDDLMKLEREKLKTAQASLKWFKLTSIMSLLISIFSILIAFIALRNSINSH